MKCDNKNCFNDSSFYINSIDINLCSDCYDLIYPTEKNKIYPRK